MCTGCLLAKQTRKTFPCQAGYCAKNVLESIHGDLCGPLSPATPSGNRYFLLIVDDYGRFMWIYMLNKKDEALESFIKFRAQVEKNSEKKTQIFRTDNGGEFCSKKFNSYCDESGIVQHFTAPYSPQQNGLVEGRNRTVVSMVRSLLQERNLPV